MVAVLFQVLTVGAILTFTAAEWVGIGRKRMVSKDRSHVLWYVHARRIGSAGNGIRSRLLPRRRRLDSAALEDERYLMGNRLRDDIYIDASGKPIRMFINVQKERIFLTVLEGTVRISNHLYAADETRRIEIGDRTRISIADIEVEFIRKGEGI